MGRRRHGATGKDHWACQGGVGSIEKGEGFKRGSGSCFSSFRWRLEVLGTGGD